MAFLFSLGKTWDFHQSDRYSVSRCNMITYVDMLLLYTSAITSVDGAKELKISKSIVYRIIRNGELEAVNIVDIDTILYLSFLLIFAIYVKILLIAHIPADSALESYNKIRP